MVSRTSRGFDGGPPPQSFTLLDIKTFDVAGATHINAQHTDARRFATRRTRERGRKPSNRSERGKPWLRDLAISFVTDAADPRGLSSRCLS